jgi:hypothetical protein
MLHELYTSNLNTLQDAASCLPLGVEGQQTKHLKHWQPPDNALCTISGTSSQLCAAKDAIIGAVKNPKPVTNTQDT